MSGHRIQREVDFVRQATKNVNVHWGEPKRIGDRMLAKFSQDGKEWITIPYVWDGRGWVPEAEDGGAPHGIPPERTRPTNSGTP